MYKLGNYNATRRHCIFVYTSQLIARRLETPTLAKSANLKIDVKKRNFEKINRLNEKLF
jgi:hypothetical protein